MWVMPAGPSCSILLQPCWFGWKYVTLSFSALLCKTYVDAHTLPPPTSTQGCFRFYPLQRELPAHRNYVPKRHQKTKLGGPERASEQEQGKGGAAAVQPPHRASLLPDPCPCTSAPFLHKPPTCSTAYFYPGRWQEPGAACGTRLFLLNSGHVGTGSEEAAALAVMAHEGAAELFSGQ